MGTDKESFIELTERIGRKTGGLSVYPFTSAKRGAEQPVAYVMVGSEHARLFTHVTPACCTESLRTYMHHTSLL